MTPNHNYRQEKWKINIQSHPSSRNLNMRGFGFPSWGTGVTDPISTKPKPNPSNPSTASAFLSKPAARPIGLVNFFPQTSIPIIGWSGLFSTGTHPRAAAETANLWANSASRNAKNGFTTFVALNNQPLQNSFEHRLFHQH